MKIKELSALPIVLSNKTNYVARWVYLILVAAILTYYIKYGIRDVDDMVDLLASSIVLILIGEAIHWFIKPEKIRVTLDRDNISFFSPDDSWKESISSYESLDWHEEMTTDTTAPELKWYIELKHQSNPKHSVKIDGSLLSGINKDDCYEIWRMMRKVLEISGEKIAGYGVDFDDYARPVSTLEPSTKKEISSPSSVVDVSASLQEPLKYSTDTSSTDPVLRRSLWIIGLLLLISGVVLYLLLVEASAISFTLGTVITIFVWGLTLTKFRFSRVHEKILIEAYLGPIKYKETSVPISDIRGTTVYGGWIGPGSLLIERNNNPPISYGFLKGGDVYDVKKWLSQSVLE